MQLEIVVVFCFQWSADLAVNTAVVFAPRMIILLRWRQIADRIMYGAEGVLVKSSEQGYFS